MSPDLVRMVAIFLMPPLVVLTLQAAVMRLFPKKSRQLLTMVAMVLGYLIFFCILNLFDFEMPHNLAFYTYFFLIYSFSAYTYFHFFNMSETSRRVRMLNMIAHRSESDLQDLSAIYDDKQMLEVRLNRLVSLGQITERQGRFYPRGRLFVYTAIAFYGFAAALSRPWAPMQKFIQHQRNAK